MTILKKLFALTLAVLFLNLYLVNTVFAQQNWYAKAEITKHKPVIRSLPEEKIPVEVVKEGGGSKLIWVLVGVAAIGGVAAAAGGGSSGGGGGDGTEPTAETGTVAVSW
jgi:hypothetical protein